MHTRNAPQDAFKSKKVAPILRFSHIWGPLFCQKIDKQIALFLDFGPQTCIFLMMGAIKF